MDKAGSYAIQGLAKVFISSINGSYTNVIGLPLSCVLDELEKIGLWTYLSYFVIPISDEGSII